MFLVLGGVVHEHLEGAVTGRKARPGNLLGGRHDHTILLLANSVPPSSCLTALSAARKPTFEWVPSQNGLFVDPPQRHSATVARSARNSLPSASSSTSGPLTRYGPSSRAVIFVRSVMTILLF